MLSSSELGLPHRLTRRRVCTPPPPPPLVSWGGTHSLAGEGGGTQFCGSLGTYICMYEYSVVGVQDGPEKYSLLISQAACKLLNIPELPCRGKIRYKCLRPTEQIFRFFYEEFRCNMLVTFSLQDELASSSQLCRSVIIRLFILFFGLAEKQNRYHINIL